MKNKIGVGILLVIALMTILLLNLNNLKNFIAKDNCLDKGGCYNSISQSCEMKVQENCI